MDKNIYFFIRQLEVHSPASSMTLYQLLLALLMFAALACTKNSKYTALLNNAAKISEGDTVTSAGLVIGKIRAISLQRLKSRGSI